MNKQQPTIIFYGTGNSGKSCYFATLYKSSNDFVNLSGISDETIKEMTKVVNLLEKGKLPDKTSNYDPTSRDLKVTTKNFKIDISFFDFPGELINEHAGYEQYQSSSNSSKNFISKLNEKLEQAIGICYIIPYSNQAKGDIRYEKILPDALDQVLSKHKEVPFSILVTKIDQKYPEHTISTLNRDLNQEAIEFLKKNYEVVYNKLSARKYFKVFASSILDQFICRVDQKDQFSSVLEESFVFKDRDVDVYRKISGYQVLEPIDWILNQSYQQQLKAFEAQISTRDDLSLKLESILALLKFYKMTEDLSTNEKYQILKASINALFLKNQQILLKSSIKNINDVKRLLQEKNLQKFLNDQSFEILKKALDRAIKYRNMKWMMISIVSFLGIFFSYSQYATIKQNQSLQAFETCSQKAIGWTSLSACIDTLSKSYPKWASKNQTRDLVENQIISQTRHYKNSNETSINLAKKNPHELENIIKDIQKNDSCIIRDFYNTNICPYIKCDEKDFYQDLLNICANDINLINLLKKVDSLVNGAKEENTPSKCIEASKKIIQVDGYDFDTTLLQVQCKQVNYEKCNHLYSKIKVTQDLMDYFSFHEELTYYGCSKNDLTHYFEQLEQKYRSEILKENNELYKIRKNLNILDRYLKKKQSVVELNHETIHYEQVVKHQERQLDKICEISKVSNTMLDQNIDQLKKMNDMLKCDDLVLSENYQNLCQKVDHCSQKITRRQSQCSKFENELKNLVPSIDFKSILSKLNEFYDGFNQEMCDLNQYHSIANTFLIKQTNAIQTSIDCEKFLKGVQEQSFLQNDVEKIETHCDSLKKKEIEIANDLQTSLAFCRDDYQTSLMIDYQRTLEILQEKKTTNKCVENPEMPICQTIAKCEPKVTECIKLTDGFKNLSFEQMSSKCQSYLESDLKNICYVDQYENPCFQYLDQINIQTNQLKNEPIAIEKNQLKTCDILYEYIDSLGGISHKLDEKNLNKIEQNKHDIIMHCTSISSKICSIEVEKQKRNLLEEIEFFNNILPEPNKDNNRFCISVFQELKYKESLNLKHLDIFTEKILPINEKPLIENIQCAYYKELYRIIENANQNGDDYWEKIQPYLDRNINQFYPKNRTSEIKAYQEWYKIFLKHKDKLVVCLDRIRAENKSLNGWSINDLCYDSAYGGETELSFELEINHVGTTPAFPTGKAFDVNCNETISHKFENKAVCFILNDFKQTTPSHIKLSYSEHDPGKYDQGSFHVNIDKKEYIGSQISKEIFLNELDNSNYEAVISLSCALNTDENSPSCARKLSHDLCY